MNTQLLPAAPYSASGFEAGAPSVGPDPADSAPAAAAGTPVDRYRELLTRLVAVAPRDGYLRPEDLPPITDEEQRTTLAARWPSIWDSASFFITRDQVLAPMLNSYVPGRITSLGRLLHTGLDKAVRAQLLSDAEDARLLGVDEVRL